jgi:isopentenyldiphosphate isomerase
MDTINSELIDVVDENAMPTGRCETRDVVHRLGLRHRTVHIWLINSKKEVLIQQRAESKENYGGMWDISCAGHISAGETSMQAALKELSEELGVHPEHKPEYLFSLWSSVTLNGGLYIDNEYHDVYAVIQDIPVDRLVLQKTEVASVQYIHFKDLEDLIRRKDASIVPHGDEYKRVFLQLSRL